MLWFYATMMRPFDPSLQVAEDEMDHGQVGFGLVWIAAERQRVMAVSNPWQFWIRSPSVSAHHSAKCDIVFDEVGERFRTPIWHNAKPQPSRVDAPLVFFAVICSRTNLYSADNDRFVMRSATFATCLTADHAFVNFDWMLAPDGVTLGANHTGAQLVEYLKGSLIAGKRKLALELDGRLSRYLRGHEVCAPKPRRERRMARLHYRSCRQRCVGLAATAAQHHRRPGCETVRLADKAALCARKPARPTNGLEIASASRIVGKYPLKLRKRSGETANVHV
jgi:hypothetical protein